MALVLWSGVRIGGDTSLYLDGASSLLNGQPLIGRQPSYLGYIAVVAGLQAAGGGLVSIVIIQLAAATVAAIAVYRIAVELGGRVAGALAVLLFAVDVETNRWHAFVLGDSLFLSFLVITAWLVHRATAAPARFDRHAVAVLSLIATALIRPEGWFVVPAAAGYWILQPRLSMRRRVAFVGAALLGCIAISTLVTPRLGGNLEAVGPGEMLRRGQTIWDYDGWRVAMPDDPVWSTAHGSAAAVGYAVRHPISTASLMIARLAVHAAHVRPFYSTAHNVMIAAWLLPLYALGAIGWWAARHHRVAWWCAGVIATQALVVALTHAEWDGRYLAHVMPLLYPSAASGLGVVLLRAAPDVHARLITP